MRIPKTIYKIKSNILFILGLVLFVLFFAIIYTPNYGLSEDATGLSDIPNVENRVQMWYSHQSICLPLCCAIVLVVTTLSRTFLLLFTKTRRLREIEYLWWQISEVAITSIFINLFLSLFFHYPFFSILPMVMIIYLSVCTYPYAFYWLLAERLERDIRLAEAQRTITRLRRDGEEDTPGMLRFIDDKGNVRLVVGTENVVYLEAAGNYVTILYISAGRLTRYSLRNTLKSIDETCAGTPIIHCHRSYYINLLHVRLLKKTTDGIVAEIDVEGVDPIPISKSYADEVTVRFSKL